MSAVNIKIKNVIFVYDYCFVNGGAAKVAIDSAIALANESSYNVYYYGAVGPVCEELKQSKVKTYCLSIDDINSENRIGAAVNGIWNVRAKKSFGLFLNHFSNKNTIIHVHGWSKALSSSVLRIATKKHFKCIVTLHDYFCVCPNGIFYNYNKKKICTLKPMSIKCVLCSCDKRNYFQKIWRVLRQFVQDFNVKRNSNITYITISDLNKRIASQYLYSRRFEGVKNIVEFQPLKNDLVSESNNYICVGRVSEEKGVDVFCRAISELKSEYDINGIVIGDGPLLEELKKQYRKITFVGWKNHDEMYEYMTNARALVFPSKCYEGAPLTIVEALSAKLPCVVSDCTSAVELIRDGFNGFIFKTNSCSGLKRGIIKMQSEETRLRMIKNIEESFDPKEYSDKYHVDRLIQIYEKVICD